MSSPYVAPEISNHLKIKMVQLFLQLEMQLQKNKTMNLFMEHLKQQCVLMEELQIMELFSH